MTAEKRRLFIDEKELAALYGVAVQTVRNWRFRRTGPPYSKLNRMVRYDYDTAIKYMDSFKVDLSNKDS